MVAERVYSITYGYCRARYICAIKRVNAFFDAPSAEEVQAKGAVGRSNNGIALDQHQYFEVEGDVLIVGFLVELRGEFLSKSLKGR